MNRLPAPSFWSGKRVFLTGHTGFKGTWARLWLSQLGAQVFGYALSPVTNPALHALVGGTGLAGEAIADLRDVGSLENAIRRSSPDVILHMAAQPLVRRSYAQPVETFDVNVMGTIRLLETARQLDDVKAILVITTDKVYSNDESGRHFTEDDRLGGHDPYSGSKAAAEIATATYRDSFYGLKGVRVATARGGNVIGGGDFSEDRLIPDIVRAALDAATLDIRSPLATRPWQHVLDCLNGYFIFCEDLVAGKNLPTALNFGPPIKEGQIAVGEVASSVQSKMGIDRRWRDTSAGEKPREMQTLGLNPEKAWEYLSWQPKLSQHQAIEWTGHWYNRWRTGDDALTAVMDQIHAYTKGA